MALKMIPELDEVVEGLGVPGIAAIVLLPVIIPAVGGISKSLTKATIKGGIVLYEKGKGVIAEVGENFEDIIAEAKAELAEQHTSNIEPASTEEEVS
ncbi:DUF5132 domain-containing protein [Nostocaceae cyanobacterium CENA357]|uniref:DUF5132 domain-containing protein n=1 Tax=Atlanticothrix silvestris CENA357 TaxID=1725252 RepID=A0A8J7HJD1_9CYAN|nr:DUF5132 domain-containing protein [Atlanticothrix silvestris]MBH8556156.1 DUF5132 domain-containing protein [Atlanticothrix silvestris CENA357]